MMLLQNQSQLRIKPHDFILVERNNDLLQGFECTINFGKYVFYYGDRVNVYSAYDKLKDARVLLVGYCIDILNPYDDETAICTNILKRADNIEEIWELSENFAGRWLLLYQNGNEYYVIPDCCAFRQVFYCVDGKESIASNPDLLSLINRLRSDSSIQEYERIEKHANMEYAFPFYATRYLNVRRVLPNHILLMHKKTVKRMWPDRLKENSITEKNAEDIKNMFSVVTEAVLRKFPKIAFSLTAGLDSRVAISALSKHLINTNHGRISTFTHALNGQESLDVDIARKISQTLDIEHRKVPYSLKDNTPYEYNGKHYYWDVIDSAIGDFIGDDTLIVKGSASEICRFPYGRLPGWGLQVDIIRKTSLVSKSDYSNRVIADWCSNTAPVAKDYGVDLFDLVYWEHRMGSWQAQGQYESNDYYETFSPFNCRAVIKKMLEIEWKKRIPPYSLYQDYFVNKEIQQFQINKTSTSFLGRIRYLIKYRCRIVNLISLNIRR